MNSVSTAITGNPETIVQGQDAAVLVSDVLETLASEFSGLLREVHKMAREAGRDVARAVGEAVASLSEPEEVMTSSHREARSAAESQRIQADRVKRFLAQQDERRILGLAEDAQDQAKRIKEAELRGFCQGRNQALREVIAIQEKRVARGDEAFCVLMDIKRAIVFMQKEA